MSVAYLKSKGSLVHNSKQGNVNAILEKLREGQCNFTQKRSIQDRLQESPSEANHRVMDA